MITVSIDLDTADYVTIPTSAVSITLTPQRAQIILSLAIFALERGAWESLNDSAWDAWLAGLSEMVEQIQDY